VADLVPPALLHTDEMALSDSDAEEPDSKPEPRPRPGCLAALVDIGSHPQRQDINDRIRQDDSYACQ
jgi:hypothetical protein